MLQTTRTPAQRRQLLTHTLALAAVIAASLFAPVHAQAQPQAFPTKPVRLVVTYPAGGSSDLMARITAQKLSEHWGQQVNVESKPGAAGSIGMEFAARQPADGYTLVIGNLGPAAVNPLISKVPYSMEKDFIPIALTATGPNILVVHADSPYKNLNDIVAAARAKPGSVTFGTSGPGSMSHLATELLMRQGGVKMVNVPYKGGGQAVNDLLGGQLGFMISDALPVVQFIKTGKLRALAITSAARSPLFPDIPTFAEGGIQGLVAENWWGVFLPAGTPKAVVDNYHAALVKVMADTDTKDKFAGLGVQARASTQAEFRSFLAAETAKYAKLVADNNIKAE
jgi:tripartite-type tricarboxylate transporter receptor subunit TctC